MAKYFSYRSDIFRSDTVITLTSTFGATQMYDSIDIDGSEETNFKNACAAHMAAFISLPASSTSPQCYVAESGKWVKLVPSADIASNLATVKVPTGNSGILILHDEGGSYTMEYSVNGGSWTSFVDGGTVTVADNDTLAFKATGLDEQESANGTVEDSDTGRVLDAYSLMNSTSSP